jgi:hypothetical protein
MSKLNAEELAAKRYAQYRRSTSTEAGITGYAAAIREVAQPIADERDELLEALQRILSRRDVAMQFGDDEVRARAAIAKATGTNA